MTGTLRDLKSKKIFSEDGQIESIDSKYSRKLYKSINHVPIREKIMVDLPPCVTCIT